jgi:hypothetical protein
MVGIARVCTINNKLTTQERTIYVRHSPTAYKRYMLISEKLAADFSRGCAGQRIGHLLFATHLAP